MPTLYITIHSKNIYTVIIPLVQVNFNACHHSFTHTMIESVGASQLICDINVIHVVGVCFYYIEAVAAYVCYLLQIFPPKTLFFFTNSALSGSPFRCVTLSVPLTCSQLFCTIKNSFYTYSMSFPFVILIFYLFMYTQFRAHIYRLKGQTWNRYKRNFLLYKITESK